MTVTETVIDVPTCECVKAARQLSKIFPVHSKYVTDGTAAGSDVHHAMGWFKVGCGYCGAVLKTVDGLDYTKLVKIEEQA